MHIISKTIFSGLIWKMAIDQKSNWLALEIRSEKFNHALFSTINIETGKTGINEQQTESGWSSGLEAIRNGIVLIHGFEFEGSPAHKGLVAFDAENGQVLWRNYALSVDAVFNNYFLAFDRKILPPKIFAADWKTGKLISSTQNLPDEMSTLRIPQKLNNWPQHLPKSFSEEVIGLVDYLVQDNVEIISLHTPNEGAFQQHLFVYQAQQIIHSDLLHTGIQKLQPDAFVMQRNRLVYIRNKNELVLMQILPDETSTHP